MLELKHSPLSVDSALALSSSGHAAEHVHQLDVLLSELCEERGICSRHLTIRWGSVRRRASRRRQRSICLGSYTMERSLIRIHPVLDNLWVPRFFVRYIIFHELLHHLIPTRIQGRRRICHGPEFRAHERAYPDYQRAQLWQQAFLPRLLREATQLARS